MMSTSIDTDLVDRVRRGDYQVAPEAVAEAILRRWEVQSAVLVAAQALYDPAVRTGQGEAAAGADVA
jgi:hypothetical protein